MHPQNLDKPRPVAERPLRHPGIDRPFIGRLVRAFYCRVRQDERLGQVVEDDFAIWLGLFHATVRELCKPDVAAVSSTAPSASPRA